MSKLISIQDETYRSLAKAAGQINQIRGSPTSLSATASLSIVLLDTWIPKIMEEAKKDVSFGQALDKALRKMDRNQLKELLLSSLKD